MEMRRNGVDKAYHSSHLRELRRVLLAPASLSDLSGIKILFR
jgi:hypothetical protein